MVNIEQSIVESARRKLCELESIAIEPVTHESTDDLLSRYWMITAFVELANFDSGLSASAADELQKIDSQCAAIISARAIVIDASR